MPENDSSWQKMMKYLSAGTEFIVIFGLLLWGGLLLDRRLGTLPVFTLIGSIAGFVLGLYRLIKEARQAQKDFEKKDRPKDNEES